MSASLLDQWPDLDIADMTATTDTLHLWSQIVGKIRLATTPWLNHSWHVPLYLSARGLNTGPIIDAGTTFDMTFDLIDAALVVRVADGRRHSIGLRPSSVAAFHAELFQALASLGITTKIDGMPCEIANATPFEHDHVVRMFDAEVALTYWRALLQVQRVFALFRTRFLGKCSPIQLFWGSFDLVSTRFSGRAAPRHKGHVPHMPDAVVRDAYSHEQWGAGFWPGSGDVASPSFYVEAYPAPLAFGEARALPAAARYDPTLQEFVLLYDAVRRSADPDGDLLAFLQTTYEAVADAGSWDRGALERPQGEIGYPPAD